MIQLGQVELVNNLVVIYLKGLRMMDVLDLPMVDGTFISKYRTTIKKYLLFLKKYIERENIPSYKELLELDASKDEDFFEDYKITKEKAEEIRFILMKIVEVYVAIYDLPKPEWAMLRMTKDKFTDDNIKLGMKELSNIETSTNIVIASALTIIKEIEDALTNIEANFKWKERTPINLLSVTSELPLHIDKDKIMEVIGKILKVSKKI